MRRALALAWLVVPLLLALPALAASYGVSTTYVGELTASTGAWSAIGPAQSDADAGAAATLSEADAGGVAASLLPANRDFASSSTGWTGTTGTCSGLGCSATAAYDGTTGDPAGSVQVSLTSGVLAAASVTSTWRSPSFTWSSGAPESVAFAIDRRRELATASGASWNVQLVDETGGDAATSLLSGSLPLATDAGFTTVSAGGLASTLVQDGHRYHVLITTTMSVAANRTVRVRYDDVTLTVTPRNRRGVGELRVTNVTAGGTMTLETRARTDGEAFDLQVWNGSAWIDRLAVTSTSFATLSHGLAASEVNGGQVRVRAVDRSQGVDDTTSQLLVDHLRVVSTGAVSVTAPAGVTLPAHDLDGHGGTSSASVGTVEVVDTGGVASGWTLSATATRWALVADGAVMLPAGAATLAPGAVTSPSGSSLTGLSAGGAGALGATPLTLLQAAGGTGIGTYRLSPTLSLAVPANAMGGEYRSVVTLTVS